MPEELVPRWRILEAQVSAYQEANRHFQENTHERLVAIEKKVDTIQSFVDNMQGRWVVLIIVISVVSPLIVSLAVGLLLKYL